MENKIGSRCFGAWSLFGLFRQMKDGFVHYNL